MAKILTWADMPTGIIKGSPTNRCPTRSMIEANVMPNFAATFLNTIASDQLVSDVRVSQTTKTFRLNLFALYTSTSANYSGYRQIVNISGDVTEGTVLSTEPTDTSYDNSITYTWGSSVSEITISLGTFSGFDSSSKRWVILSDATKSLTVTSGATITSTIGTLYGLTLTGSNIIATINVSGSGSGSGGLNPIK